MQIKIEDLSPRPVINFYFPTELSDSVAVFFSSEHAPDFISEVLQISGMERCFIAGKILSVKFSTSADRDLIKSLVPAIMDDYINSISMNICGEIHSLYDKCEALADALIRPTLNRDKGDIEIYGCDNGIVELKFTGHCSGCPYAQNTLEHVILRIFKQYLPQIKEIRLKE